MQSIPEASKELITSNTRQIMGGSETDARVDRYSGYCSGSFSSSSLASL